MYWVVLANSNQFRIYAYDKKTHQIILQKESHHEDSKKKSGDLISDKPGHYKSSGPSHGAFSPRTDAKENEIDHFLRSLAEELETGRANNRYNKLIIFAAPHMDGLLNSHINKNVSRMIVASLKKDYITFTDKELLAYLKEHWQTMMAE